LYPIFEFTDNGARVAGSATEELSTDDDLGCSVSSSNGVYKWSGACVSVQCDLGSGSYAGPATSGSSSSRTTGVSNTASATFQSHTLASIPSGADQIKNVFLYRTGGHVATYSRATSGKSNSISYSVGNLPTSNGNDYGPVACPSRNNLLTSSTATGITAANLRMCGSTGKWVYYNAINLLKDASLYAKYSGNTGSTSDINIASVPFLAGKSAYKSGTAMDDSRAVKLLSSSSSSSAISMTSETITPLADGAATGQTAGTWRSYGVVFYCDDYARTDLTTCAATNQKMFYVGDPNPNAFFGTTAGASGSSASPTPSPSSTPRPFVTGSLSVTVSDTSAILSDSSIKIKFQNAMAREIATLAGVAATDVTVTVSAGRRLDAASAMRRLASGVLSVSYSISVSSSTSAAAVATSVGAATTTDLQNKVNAALTATSVTGVTATGVVIAVAPTEQGTTPSPTPTRASTDFACGNFDVGRLVALAAVIAAAQFHM